MPNMPSLREGEPNASEHFDASENVCGGLHVGPALGVAITFWNSQGTECDWTFDEVCANRSQQAVSEESIAELPGETDSLFKQPP